MSPNRSLRLTALAVAATIGLCACGGTKHAASTTNSTSPTSSPATGAASATALEQQYVAVVKRTQIEVVQIQTQSGLGSGVIFDDKGDIVTNAHVIGTATQLQVTLADGRRFAAHRVGAYVPDDLAVISIGGGHGVKAATFADSSKLSAGEIVLAEGNPLGLQSSVTDGIISALGRSVNEGQGIVLPDTIQTSAPINPGNSGGALLDLRGQVVGIPTLAAANPQLGSTAAGIGFAIPSSLVTDIAGQIVRHGRVVNSHRAAIGASLADSAAGAGALVVELQPGGPAANAGVAVGDLIERIDGTPIADVSALATTLTKYQPGQRITVAIRRPDGTGGSVTLKLGQLPGS